MRRAGDVLAGTWHRVAEVGELSDRETKVVAVGGKRLALTRIGERYGAIDNACPHQGGPIGEGGLGASGCLECPWHGWTFDAFTGAGVSGTDVVGYPVEIRSGAIYVRMGPGASARLEG